MRPRNVLTETNNMRKLMGLPLLKEDGGQTIDDVKKKVLNESTIEYEDDQWLVIDKEEDKEEDEDKDEVNENAPAFSLGFAQAGGLTIDEGDEHNCETEHPDHSHSAWEKSKLGETTLAQAYDNKGVGKNNLEADLDAPINEIEKAQKMAEERALKEKRNKVPMEDNVMQEFIEDIDGAGDGYGGELGGDPGIDVGYPQAGDGEGGLGRSPEGMVFAEDIGFAKYNITLDD